MTETDATKRPLEMPDTFLPYLEKHRLYKLFKYRSNLININNKDMVQDLVLNLPKDHLKHMKTFLNQRLHSTKNIDRVMVLISPELNIDKNRLIQDMIKKMGLLVITRRCVMDCYVKHDSYVPGCISPELMSEITKTMTLKTPVPEAGWLMFDHPCTIREARCMQQDGILPTVTLVMMPTPPVAPPASDHRTPARGFFQQDFEGLKFVYNATLKEVHIDAADNQDAIATKCFNAIRAAEAGAQGPGQGFHAVGAPSVYRVLLIGPRGSGRRTQAVLAAKRFGLVCLNFENLLREAQERMDEIGEKIRKFGISVQLKADIVRRRITQKDCIDQGWILTAYPESATDFELLDNMPTSPNRVIILNVGWAVCKKRAMAHAVDWCTGETVPNEGPRAVLFHQDEAKLDAELDTFFTETLAELRAAAGITAVEVDGHLSKDEVQVKIQAAIMAAPTFNIEHCSALRNVCAD